MNKVQQAAAEYAEKNFPFIWPVNKEGEKIVQLVGQKNPPGSAKAKRQQQAHINTFLAGAAHTEGAFAEWASLSGYYYIPDKLQWVHVEDHDWLDTKDLYKIWQQQL